MWITTDVSRGFAFRKLSNIQYYYVYVVNKPEFNINNAPIIKGYGPKHRILVNKMYDKDEALKMGPMEIKFTMKLNNIWVSGNAIDPDEMTHYLDSTDSDAQFQEEFQSVINKLEKINDISDDGKNELKDEIKELLRVLSKMNKDNERMKRKIEEIENRLSKLEQAAVVEAVLRGLKELYDSYYNAVVNFS